MSTSNDILKIKYTVSSFDFDKMAPGRRKVYELFPDGRIFLRCYEAGSRKCCYKEVFNLDNTTDYHLLCAKLNDCIVRACANVMYVDDTSAEILLEHPFGRTQKMDRGLGDGETTVGNLICEYLLNHGAMR